MKPDRNQGAAMLARTGKTQTDIASEMNVSVVTAHDWFHSEKRPGAANRTRLRELYKVPEPSWDLPAETKRVPVASAAGDDAKAIGGAFAMSRELEEMARIQIEQLRNDEESSPLERARVMASIASTLNVLAKVTGQYDLGRRMLSLPIWKRIEEELAIALRDHPKAARAVAERFEQLEAETG